MEFLQQLTASLEAAPGNGTLMVLAEYRPDIARMAANHLDFRFYDYREQVMQPRGWEAADITLEQLSHTLEQESTATPLLAFNTEALLAVYSSTERAAWLRSFCHHEWTHTVLLSVTAFAEDLPDLPQQICDLRATSIPDQNLINRLLF